LHLNTPLLFSSTKDKGLDSSAVIATSHGRITGLLLEAATRDFPLFCIVQACSGALPASFTMGVLSPGVKRPSREVDHSRPTSTEVRIRGSISLNSPIRHHSLVLN
jgi:hypothetical protein